MESVSVLVKSRETSSLVRLDCNPCGFLIFTIRYINMVAARWICHRVYYLVVYCTGEEELVTSVHRCDCVYLLPLPHPLSAFIHRTYCG